MLKKILLGFLIALVVIADLAIFTKPGRVAIISAAFVPEIFPNLPFRPLSFFAKEPIYSEVKYRYDSKEVFGDLWRPDNKKKNGAVIFSLGIRPVERDHPVLVRFTKALAKSGIVVLVPDSVNLRAGKFLPEEIDLLVAAFNFLEDSDYVNDKKIGFGGFSVGSSLVAAAAANPQIAEKVVFVNFFGGYFDLISLLTSILTETASYGDQTFNWQPAEISQTYFKELLIDTLSDESERELLKKRFLQGEQIPAEQLARLSSEAKVIFQLLNAGDSRKVAELVNLLAAELLSDYQILSPKNSVDQLRAKVVVMHDRNDRLVPYVESKRFYDAIGHSKKYYAEFSFFEHVLPKEKIDWGSTISDAAKLYVAIYKSFYELL